MRSSRMRTRPICWRWPSPEGEREFQARFGISTTAKNASTNGAAAQ
jgi:hypothetical protein